MDIKEQYCTKKEKGKWKRENEKNGALSEDYTGESDECCHWVVARQQ